MKHKTPNLTPDEYRLLALYLLRAIEDLRDEHLACVNDLQDSIMCLIDCLRLRRHAEKVAHALCQQLVAHRKLTPSTENIITFEMDENPKETYTQDRRIYNQFRNWDSEDNFSINFLRIMGIKGVNGLKNLLMGIFFLPVDNRQKTITLPAKITIPKAIKELSTQTSHVDKLADAIHLSTDERRILHLAYFMTFPRDYGDGLEDMRRQGHIEGRIGIFAKLLELPMSQVRALFRKDQPLVAYGLIDLDNPPSNFITEEAKNAILTNDLNGLFCNVLRKDTQPAFPLSSFTIKQEYTSLLLRLLQQKQGANILLYGAPGSGKTEYARALAKQAGLTPLVFKNELEIESEKVISQIACAMTIDNPNAVLIIDEAENILDTSPSFFAMLMGGGGPKQKGTINKMMEITHNKVIWIVNYTNSIDQSTMRRFTYSLKFPAMTQSTIQSIAQRRLAQLPMSDSLQSSLVNLCGRYQVTGASVENMIRTLQGMELIECNEPQVLSDVQMVLEANATLLHGSPKMREKTANTYDLSVLNTSTPAQQLVTMVTNASQQESGVGFRMLFYGVSGSGKTELARYMAEKLGKRILLKRASDILGMYVGESEQNIREAFEEAKQSGDILLFDEADSFFADRQTASRSWERTIVNEFLTQMEEFPGILICTTNLRKIMDPAMQRRFHILTEFFPLQQAGIERLLQRFFPMLTFTPEDVARLARTASVTPGDFGALNSKLRFMPADCLTPSTIINELVAIQTEKNHNSTKRVGFC